MQRRSVASGARAADYHSRRAVGEDERPLAFASGLTGDDRRCPVGNFPQSSSGSVWCNIAWTHATRCATSGTSARGGAYSAATHAATQMGAQMRQTCRRRRRTCCATRQKCSGTCTTPMYPSVRVLAMRTFTLAIATIAACSRTLGQIPMSCAKCERLTSVRTVEVPGHAGMASAYAGSLLRCVQASVTPCVPTIHSSGLIAGAVGIGVMRVRSAARREPNMMPPPFAMRSERAIPRSDADHAAR